jgi:hypothetical protein
MLRITAQSADDELFVKLEGCLAGPWVRELDTCWREMAGPHDRVRVDLRDVCHVDNAGRELLAVMFRAGVRFMARGCDLPELLREIELAEAGN